MRRVFRLLDKWNVMLALLGVAIGIWVALSPAPLAVGLPLFLGVLVLGLEQPLTLVSLLLLTTWVPLAIFEGGSPVFPGSDLNLSGVRLIAVVLGLALYLPTGRLRTTSWRGGRIYWLFLAWGAGTLLYAPDRLEGLRDLFKFAYPWLLFEVLVRAVKGPRTVRHLIRVLMAAFLMGTAAGFLLPLFSKRIFPNFVPVERTIAQFYWWISWAAYAFFFNVIALLCYGLALYHPAQRRLYLSLWGMGVLDTILSCVRIALGSLAVAWAYMEWHHHRKRALVLVPLAALGVLLLLTIFLGERMFYQGSNLSMSGLAALQLEGRQVYWAIAIQHLSPGTLLQGHGLGAYMQFSRQALGFSYGLHNDYLKLLLETGLVGLVLFVAAHVWFIRHLRGLAGTAQRPLTKALLLAAPAAHVCYLITSTTDNGIWYYDLFSSPVWCLTALALRAWDFEQHAATADELKKDVR
jgi:hypothetical protein